ATADGNVGSLIDDGSLLTVSGAVTVDATNTPLATANGFGANVGTGSVGAAVPNADIAGTTSSQLGNNVVLSAASRPTDAHRPASTRSSVTAGAGGVLVGINATVSTAMTSGMVQATTGTGVFLPDGDVTIDATSTSNQSAASTGVAVGGLL